MKRSALGVVLMIVAGRMFAGSPAEHTYKVNEDNPLFAVIPELRKAPAPKWVKPGMRLSWHAAGATIPMSYHAGMRQDPDGKWVDPTTGQHFSLDGAASASGAGYVQIEILAVHDDGVAVSQAMYGVEGMDGPVRTFVGTGAVAPPGSCGDNWISPTVLNKIADAKTEGIQIARIPYRVAGKDYKALWVSTGSATGSQSTVTDLETGIMLHTGTAGSTAASTVFLNNVPTGVGGQTNLGQSNFLGMRELKSPWAGSELPDVLRGVKKLTYSGKFQVVVAGEAAPPWQVTMVTEITGRGGDFIQGKRHMRMDAGFGAPPQTSDTEFVSSCNELMPTAIPPQKLGDLRKGQTLDTDPVTKIATTVAYVGPDQRGRDVVVLSESAGPDKLRMSAAYDRASGLCVAYSLVDPVLGSDTEVMLTGKE